MTLLILAHGWDRGAAAVAAALAARRAPVLLLTPEDLAGARWRHAVDRTGRASTELALPNGVRIHDDVGAVLYRVEGFSLPRFVRSAPRDRDYAAVEFQALVSSWLHGLRVPVVNPVGGAGSVRISPRHWSVLGARHGLPVARCGMATSPRARGRRSLIPTGRRVPAGEVLVTGDRASGGLAAAYGEACVAVAAAAARPHACFRFGVEAGQRVLTGVDDPPALADPPSAAVAADHLIALARGRS